MIGIDTLYLYRIYALKY